MEFLIILSIVLFFVFIIYCIHSGVFCKIIGHNFLACGWTEVLRGDGMSYSVTREATDFYCERCGVLKNRVQS